jgi:hypothetical protein
MILQTIALAFTAATSIMVGVSLPPQYQDSLSSWRSRHVDRPVYATGRMFLSIGEGAVVAIRQLSSPRQVRKKHRKHSYSNTCGFQEARLMYANPQQMPTPPLSLSSYPTIYSC